MRVSDLKDALLDYWVACAQGTGRAACIEREGTEHATLDGVPVLYSRDWTQGGPLVERLPFAALERDGGRGEWRAVMYRPVPSAGERCTFSQSGPTLLVAAMRTYVAVTFGDEVPNEVMRA